MSEDLSSVETSSNESDTPSPERLASPLPRIERWIDNLHLTEDMAPASVAGSTMQADATNRGPKAGSPTEFTGRRDQVEAFILQCRVVFAMDQERWTTNHKRMMYIVSFMKGQAFEWIKPHLSDYVEHLSSLEARKASTRAILGGSDVLFGEIRATFGHGNEQQEAERAIQVIRQRGSAAKYKAEFQILVAKLEWNDQAIAAQFYRGLKDHVKDEISREGRPTTPRAMYEMAIRIDTRIYERQMEKKGVFAPSGANRRATREVPEWKDNYYGLQKMQLDATHGKPRPKGNRKGKPGPMNESKKKPFDKTNLECHNCGQKGHFARECKARKQRHELQKPTYGTIAATNQDKHANLTWIACYDDNCHIHRSDKEGSGYWPGAGKAQSVCVLRIAPEAPQPEEESTDEEGGSDTLAAIEESESESEESSEDGKEGSSLSGERNDVLQFSMEGHGEAIKIFREVARRYEEIFPRVGNKRYLQPMQFELLLQRLRAMF